MQRESFPAQEHPDRFVERHIGLTEQTIKQMLQRLGEASLDGFLTKAIPEQIRREKPLISLEAASETQALEELRHLGKQNTLCRSFLGMGYYNCLLPAVIQRNILENPGWYTPYTPYQAEISQGRLEALLNFQTMVMDLTGMEIANASLLDEATAAAEAMMMCYNIKREEMGEAAFLICSHCHPQTIAVVETRAEALGIKILIKDFKKIDFEEKIFGALLQYPATDGMIEDLAAFIKQVQSQGALAVVACDLLAMTLLKPPGELGADVAVGSTQRFGMPMGFGGPHAAFFATRDIFKRYLPGRLIGVSKDSLGKPALRLTLQTREQHIRRDKATSNICTAQALPAVVASMYAVYHGPQGLRKISERIHLFASLLAQGVKKLGHRVDSEFFFDTVKIGLSEETADAVSKRAQRHSILLRKLDSRAIAIALDETTELADIRELLDILSAEEKLPFSFPHEEDLLQKSPLPFELKRTSSFLTHPVFNSYQSETEMLRYMKRLELKDFSLTHGMIPLGSCTMKLNATAEMLPIAWPEFARLHPFAPLDHTKGYQRIFDDLERWLADLTGFTAVSFQPNAGSQGEYAGLLIIKKYYQIRSEGQRHICLIPSSAHGTNPASAAMAGMKVVLVECDKQGNIDLNDLQTKAKAHRSELAACMVTYPSTHGVFETSIREVCAIIHANGGQVYMDGANFNALAGWCSPAELGADVCHLNLHKTFCIPHGGGGPGMGPICVARHLTHFLPANPLAPCGAKEETGPVSAAPWGSGLILTISWMYIRMMGTKGLRQATACALLCANYIARRLEPYFPILYKGSNGYVAHECILDCRKFKTEAGVEVEDIAKRLMDYGFHAPTISWPVAGTMMVEPTESESKEELDRFCEAMIGIFNEIEEIQSQNLDRANNILKNAPHPARLLANQTWNFPYTREKAVFPTLATQQNKFWPAVARIDNVYGDRNLFCSCVALET